MLNCSGVRMACHSSSDFCTGPGGGVDDDIADTPGNLRPAARPLHGRGAGRGRAAAGEGARRREESGREARGATAEGRGHECDAILSPSRRWTPMLSRWLLSGLCGVDMRSESRWSFPLWKESGSEDNRFGSSPDPACGPACGPAWIRIRMFLYSDKEASASSFDIKP